MIYLISIKRHIFFKKIINPLAVYSKKYPDYVFTMDIAFYYYDLTDVIPQNIYLAITYNARSIEDKYIIQMHVSKGNINVGKTTMKIDNIDVNIYDKERLLIEVIRKRRQIPYDYYKEIIYNYRSIANELDSKIEKYLKCFKKDISILILKLKYVKILYC